MSKRLAPTRHGLVLAALAAALTAAAVVLSLTPLLAGGLAMMLALAYGVAEVLACRALAAREGASHRPHMLELLAALLPQPADTRGHWVRLDQHGAVIGQLEHDPAGRRGLYQKRATTLTWLDTFGCWRGTLTRPADREVYIPPAISSDLARSIHARVPARTLDCLPEPDISSVRAYERGDSLRQIAWRQSAHHGELMSFEESGSGCPPVLLAVDTLDAGDSEALAATASACLQGLRRAPEILLSDGLCCLRTPLRQERFLAALMSDRAAQGPAAERVDLIERLAKPAGQAARRVLLVTCDAEGPLARALGAGPLAASLAVIETAAAPGPVGPVRDGAVPKEAPRALPSSAAPFHLRTAVSTHLAAEVAAALCCSALGALCYLSLQSLIAEESWHAFAAAMLCLFPGLGSLAGAVLRRARARRPRRAICGLFFFLLALAIGVVAVNRAFSARAGFGLFGGEPSFYTTDLLPYQNIPTRFIAFVQQGAAQLFYNGGTDFLVWDLLAMLMAAALAGLLGACAQVRTGRPALALAAIALAATDQFCMGALRPPEVAAATALALALTALAAPADGRTADTHNDTRNRAGNRIAIAGVFTRHPGHVPRALAVAVISLALGCAGTALAASLLPNANGPWQGYTADSTAASGNTTQIDTLMDLSQSIRSQSSARVLTYTDPDGIGPVYLRLSVLTSFDDDVWEASTSAASLQGDILGYTGDKENLASIVIQPESGPSPLPLGSLSAEGSEGGYTSTTLYFAPITSTDDLERLDERRAELSGQAYIGNPAAGLDTYPADLPESVTDVLEQAAMDDVTEVDDSYNSQAEAISWLVGYFTSGDFSYSLDVADETAGSDLAAIDSFLTARNGYCSHYACTFALLARCLGMSSRVAMGFMAADTTDAATGAYLVTMEQLHAWAEVWVEDVGWVAVDVTPASTGNAANQASGGTAAGTDDAQNQDASTRNAGAESTNTSNKTTENDTTQNKTAAAELEAGTAKRLSELSPTARTVAAAACLIAVAVAIGYGTRRRQRRRLEQGDWAYAWKLACRTARRARVRWPQSATEDEVADLICARLNDAALVHAVQDLAKNACQARYGTSAPRETPGAAAERATDLPALITRLRRALRR